MKYTLIRYKENGEDTCRGCVMDRWHSEFELLEFSNRKELIAAYGNLIFNDDIAVKNRYGRSEYHILISGIDLNGWHNGYNNSCRLFNRITDRAMEIAAKKHAVIEEQRLAAEKKAQDDAFAKEQERKLRKAAEEIELYNKLKQKYGE